LKPETKIEGFYNNYWPENIPDYKKTEEHIFGLLPFSQGAFISLDAGCGSGVCSLALSQKTKKVFSCDLSWYSLKTAAQFSKKLNRENIEFINADLLNMPFEDNSFDLILSWGAVHHTVNPEKALQELIGLLKTQGYLIVAVYLKTKLTFIHELVRKMCLKINSRFLKKAFIRSVALLVTILEYFGKRNNIRDDNLRIESQVEDWFFVPVKHFFSEQELREIFLHNNLTFEVLCRQTGRLKSSSNIIVRGKKIQNS